MGPSPGSGPYGPLGNARGLRASNGKQRGGQTQERSVPLASLRSARFPAGLDRPFEMVWRELPKWDCAAEAHFKLADFSRAMRRKPRNHYNVSQNDSSLSQ
jgi:hypothetical protein